MIPFNRIPDPLIECDTQNVYFPKEDSYLIIDYFKNKISHNYFDGININEIENILDMGTGSGIIAIILQFFKLKIKKFNPRIYASDILEDSIICAKRNEILNNFHNEIVFLQSDLFKSFPESLKSSFNIIVFNPPYLPSSPLFKDKNITKNIDRSWDGGLNGYEVLIEFIKKVKNFLNLQKTYHVYYTSSSRTNLDELHKNINDLGFKVEILEKRHIFFEDIFLNRIKTL